MPAGSATSSGTAPSATGSTTPTSGSSCATTSTSSTSSPPCGLGGCWATSWSGTCSTSRPRPAGTTAPSRWSARSGPPRTTTSPGSCRLGSTLPTPEPLGGVPSGRGAVRLRPVPVGADGLVDGREQADAEAAGVGLEVGAAEQLGGPAEHLQGPLAGGGGPQDHALAMEVLGQVGQPVQGGDLQVGDDGQVQQHHPRRGSLVDDDGADLVDHTAGVGEEQAPLGPDDQQAGGRLAGDDVGVVELVEQDQQRDEHGHQHPAQGHQPEPEVPLPDRADAPQRGQVDQPDRGDQDDRPQDRL